MAPSRQGPSPASPHCNVQGDPAAEREEIDRRSQNLPVRSYRHAFEERKRPDLPIASYALFFSMRMPKLPKNVCDYPCLQVCSAKQEIGLSERVPKRCRR